MKLLAVIAAEDVIAEPLVALIEVVGVEIVGGVT